MKNILFIFALIFLCNVSNVQAQSKYKILKLNDVSITSIRYLKEGKQLVSSSFRKNIVLWDIKTGKLVWNHDFDSESSEKQNKDTYTISEVLAMDVSSDGKIIAAAYTHSKVVGGWLQKGEEFNIALLDANNGRELRVLKGSNSGVLRMAFSPDGKFLASSGSDDKVIVWDINTGMQTQVIGARQGIAALSFSLTGKELLIGQSGNGENVVIWDLENKRDKTPFPLKNRFINDASFSPDGKFVAVVEELPDKVTIFDTETSQIVKSIEAPEIGAKKLMFSSDGKLLVFFDSTYTPEAGIVYLWEFIKSKNPCRMNILGSAIEAIRISPNGQEFAVGTDNGKIILYKLRERQQ